MVQFVSLCLHESFEAKLNYMKRMLALPNGDEEHDSYENLKRERTLKNWIEKTSMNDILDWFDAIQCVSIEKNEKGLNWITEMTDRDLLFLKFMGIDRSIMG